MAPPKFADLGKSTRGLFADDYVLGEKKLTLKSTASNGVNFKVEGARNDATGNVTAFLETKFSHSAGVTIKEKWNTSNNVTTEITLDKLPVAGTKAIVETVFSPNSGFGSATLKGEFAQDKFNTDFAVGKSGSVFNGVLSYQKVLLGGSVKLDKAQKPSELKAGLSFVEKDLTVSTFVTNGEVVEGSVYHVPIPNLETAVRFSWTKGQKETTFEVGSKYSFDKTTFLKAKVDLALNFGFSYTQSIYKGVSLNLSALIKGDKLNADGHQLGLGLTLEN